MPSRIYIVNNASTSSNDNRMLPISSSDLSFTSVALSANSTRVDCYVEFFNAMGAAVTPTAGEVHFSGLPISNNWVAAAGSPIKAVECSTPVSLYTPPYMDGLVQSVRVRFLGVQGAAFANVLLYKRDAV